MDLVVDRVSTQTMLCPKYGNDGKQDQRLHIEKRPAGAERLSSQYAE